MAAPTYRAATAGSTDPTSTTIARDAAIVAGDALYACIVNGGATSAPPTVPAGWALTDDAVLGTGWAGVYQHTATASEPTSWTWAGMVDSCAGSLVAVAGADTTTPTHKVSAHVNIDTSSPTGDSVTTTVGECLILALIGIGDNTGVSLWTATDPATLTERVEVQSTQGADSASAIATGPQTATGATGVVHATLAGSRNSAMFVVAVQPPQGAGPTPIDGTLSASLPALTSSAAAEQRTPAQLDTTLPVLGASATVEQRTTIVLGAALPSLSAAVEARGRTGAAVAGTLPRLTASAAVQQVTGGTLDATLPALTAAITADQVEPGAGHVAARLPALTAAITARTNTPAALASTLPALTAHAETRTMLPATVTTTLPPLTAAIHAGEPVISGAIDAALPRLTAAVTSRTLTRATIAAGLPALVARVAQTPPTVDVDVTIGAPRVGWAPGTPAVPAWSIGAPSVRRWP